MTETITESDVVSAEVSPLTPLEAELIAFIERAAVEHAMLVVAAQELADADHALEQCVTVADIGAGNARKQAALATVRELLEHVGELPTDQLAQQASRPSLDAVPPSGVARSAGHSSIEDEERALHPDREFGGCMLQASEHVARMHTAFATLGDRFLGAARSALLGQQQGGVTASVCQNSACARELPPKARLCFEAGTQRIFCNPVCLAQQQKRERGSASHG